MPERGPDEAHASARFYRRLLDLGRRELLEPLLDEALSLIVEVTGAKIAYLELFDESATPGFWKGHCCTNTDLATIRASISRGIIGYAIAEGRTISTPSALSDRRFADLGSVKAHEIQAVLCAPIGVRIAVGVIYLQGRQEGGAFTDLDRERTELFAHQLASLADRLVLRASETRHPLHEETRRFQVQRIREALERHDGNVSGVARELEVSRSFIYRVIRGLERGGE